MTFIQNDEPALSVEPIIENEPPGIAGAQHGHDDKSNDESSRLQLLLSAAHTFVMGGENDEQWSPAQDKATGKCSAEHNTMEQPVKSQLESEQH